MAPQTFFSPTPRHGQCAGMDLASNFQLLVSSGQIPELAANTAETGKRINLEHSLRVNLEHTFSVKLKHTLSVNLKQISIAQAGSVSFSNGTVVLFVLVLLLVLVVVVVVVVTTIASITAYQCIHIKKYYI